MEARERAHLCNGSATTSIDSVGVALLRAADGKLGNLVEGSVGRRQLRSLGGTSGVRGATASPLLTYGFIALAPRPEHPSRQ